MSGLASRQQQGTGQTVLVVEDDEGIADLVRSALTFTGYEPVVVGDGREGLRLASEIGPELIVLDGMLPGLDGFEVCRRLRDGGDDVPVLFLTARDQAEDRIEGLRRGADDYLTKPFSLEEFVLRVQAILKRTAPADGEDGTLTYADVELDDERHRVTRGGTLIDLSPTEFRLLRHLMLNAERVLSKGQLLDHVWDNPDGGENVVETYISYVRRKLDTDRDPLVHTVRGVGYTLRRAQS